MNFVIFEALTSDPVTSAVSSGDSYSAMRGLIRFAETEGMTDDCVREYTVSRLAADGGVLADVVCRGAEPGSDLRAAAVKDIKTVFENIFDKDIIYKPSAYFQGYSGLYAKYIRSMTAAQSPDELLDELISFYRRCGRGELAKYNAFKYDGALCGIPKVDPITFDDLVGLEYQKKILIDNTESFLRGFRANNVLLFGDRGTGKSSCVKALLNKYAADGLRVIELPKEHISDIPALSDKLLENPNKYIIYLDDLTFERHEKDYRSLKTAMEGQLRASAGNVLIYATSNRRHLIKETWSDREGGEVHANDNMQETLSLAERFGISLVFSAPTSQKEYLSIVDELLKKNGIQMTDEIGRAAVVWQMNYGGRSGRCAAQFVASYTSANTAMKGAGSNE